jgi:hypothetical protein
MCFTYLFLQEKMSAAGIWVPGAMKIEAAIDFSLSGLCGIRDTASRDRLASDTTAEHKFAGANWVGVFQIGEVGEIRRRWKQRRGYYNNNGICET